MNEKSIHSPRASIILLLVPSKVPSGFLKKKGMSPSSLDTCRVAPLSETNLSGNRDVQSGKAAADQRPKGTSFAAERKGCHVKVWKDKGRCAFRGSLERSRHMTATLGVCCRRRVWRMAAASHSSPRLSMSTAEGDQGRGGEVSIQGILVPPITPTNTSERHDRLLECVIGRDKVGNKAYCLIVRPAVSNLYG